jgi:hypothetical protein
MNLIYYFKNTIFNHFPCSRFKVQREVTHASLLEDISFDVRYSI